MKITAAGTLTGFVQENMNKRRKYGPGHESTSKMSLCGGGS